MASFADLKLATAPIIGLSGSVLVANMDASNAGFATVFRARTSSPITQVGFAANTRTGTPPTYRISLQGLNSSGMPNGSLLASATFTPPADATWNTSFQWVTLASSYTPALNEQLALVVDYSAGTINASNRLTMSTGQAVATSFPYTATLSGGTWSKSASGYPMFGYRTATQSFGFPYGGTLYGTLANAVSGYKSAVRFVVPADMFIQYQLSGARLYGRILVGPSTTARFGLWNAAGTLLASSTISADQIILQAAAGYYDLNFDSLVTLTGGVPYFVGVECLGTTSAHQVGIRGFTVAAADRSAFPLGNECYLATDAGSGWINATNVVPEAELFLSQAFGGGKPQIAANPLIIRPGVAA